MKTVTANDYIYTPIAGKGHRKQDFRSKLPQARKVPSTLLALANTNGRQLLMGVEGGKKRTEARCTKEGYRIEADTPHNRAPEVHYTMKTFHFEERSLSVVQIDKSRNRLASPSIKNENTLSI